MFLLLLSSQTQRQIQGLRKDVWLPGVHGEQGEVNQPLLSVNTADENRKELQTKNDTMTVLIFVNKADLGVGGGGVHVWTHDQHYIAKFALISF